MNATNKGFPWLLLSLGNSKENLADLPGMGCDTASAGNGLAMRAGFSGGHFLMNDAAMVKI